MPLLPNLTVRYEPADFPLPGGSEPPASPDLNTNFQALADNNTAIPPDTHGAVGTNHLFTMLNTTYRIQTLGGSNIVTGTLSNFWGPIWPYNIQVFDPRVVYDTVNHRWIATALTGPRTVNSFLLVGISGDASPTNGFYYARLKADTNSVAWADYPSVGLNQLWFVIHVNMFAISDNALLRSQIYVFNRTNWYAGGFANPTILTHTNANPTNPTGGLETPATTYDTNVDTLYLVQNVVTNSNARVRLFSITGSVNSPSLNTNLAYLEANETWNWSGGANFAPQQGLTNKIDNNDARIQNVVYRNGYLWFTHTVFLPSGANNATRSAIQWWQVDPATTSIVQRARIEDPSGVTFYAYPSIGVNRFNDVLVGYSTFSTNQYASAGYSFRAFNDTSGIMRGGRGLKAGEGGYYKTFGGTRNRWGDYSATVVDPRNSADLWTLQQYAATPVPSGLTNGTGRWGTWWGQVAVVTPSNDNFSAATVISGTQGSTSGTNVRATKEAGERNHLGQTNTVSVWYRWTPTTNSTTVVDTIGSSFDNLIAVYTGSTVGSLTLVTNDHGSAGLFSSRVVFSAAANTTYQIAVDGWAKQQGDLVLNWVQPAVPVFVTQPVSQWVVASNSVTFTSSAVGVPDPAYRWRLNSTPISGATSATFTKNNVQMNDGGDYTVVATNLSGSVTSVVAHLSVYHSASATLVNANYTNRQFRFYVIGITNASYIVQSSTNLRTNLWVNLATNPAPITFTNQVSTNDPYKFFRVLYQP